MFGIDPVRLWPVRNRVTSDQQGPTRRWISSGIEGGCPRAEDWEALWEFVLQNPAVQAGFVDQDTRFNATVQLMPYLHPKLKSVQVTGEIEHMIRVVPLTEADIIRIKEHLNNDF